MNLRFFRIALLVGLSVLTAQAVMAQPGAVRVGCLFPLTGPGGLYGRDSAIAVQMAKDHLQALAPSDYPQLDISIEDTRSKALRSVQIAKSFIQDSKVDFLCGVVSSSIARAVSAEALRSRTFFIGTDHASPSLVTDDLHPYYFRVSNGTRQSMFAGAQYIAENHQLPDRPLRIAFIGPDYEYGYQAWDDLRAFLDQRGVSYEVAGEFWPKLFETDYTVYLQQLSTSDLDIVVSGHWGLDLVTFVKQATQFDLFEQAQFMNFDAGGNYEVFAGLGNDMPLGLVLSARHHVNWPPTGQNRDFVQQFYERAGRYPSYAAQGAYAGILAIAEAVRVAGGTKDKGRLRLALESLELSLPEDPQGFKSRMDPATHQLLQVQAIGHTVFNNTYPPATVQLGDWSIYHPPAQWPRLPPSPTAE
ncbi:ABC transporter substrate-binding protein [Ruegeria halocynthiae]|uniref:ABC transporter substrate-binding protein n=1 Tax=Ruegeria halocynthiae TaxID=985054 RepID=UPI00068A9665|nr:ABC transporter substrate-binding protein [Ruegeria halocynthiae]